MQNNLIDLPKHIAIIPDGNRRWAKDKGLPSFAGHKKGFDVALKIGRYARNIGIHTLTLWGFSTENWNRSKLEIDYLMNIFVEMISKNLKEAKESETKIYHLGRKDRLPKTLVTKLREAEEETKQYTKHVFNIALDYGGHDEILRAVEKILVRSKNESIDLFNTIGTYQQKYPYYEFKKYLDTRDQPHPYPDLIIRTSGEQRLSGYMSWQSAYAENYFETDHFPDFSPEKLQKAIDWYLGRNRRFGGN
jgi:undecaprenyl diphosphate synthase